MGCGNSTANTEEDRGKGHDTRVGAGLRRDFEKNKKIHKLLLLGTGNSGKSTFLKQLTVIHKGELEKDEITHGARYIHDALVVQMKHILSSCLDEFKFALQPSSQEAADMLEDLPPDAVISDIGRYIEILWNDDAIKKAFANRTNLGIVDSCPHFFNDIQRIARDDYVPTEQDILFARIPTTGIRTIEFEVRNNKFSVFDVGGQRSERRKWIDCFDSVHAVLFVASLSCYDQFLYEENDKNAMTEAIELFDQVINSRYFKKTSMILFLNKSDLFKLKIQQKPLTMCFPEYNDENAFDPCVDYVRSKFKEKNLYPDKQIYSHVTCATDRNNVQKVFDDVQHGVVMRALANNGLI